MSSPKITSRPQRVIKTECEPCQFFRPSIPLIYREIYEDGASVLFIRKIPVRSIHYDYSITQPSRLPNALLTLADGTTVRLKGVPPQEGMWLLQSMEGTI